MVDPITLVASRVGFRLVPPSFLWSRRCTAMA